MPESIEDAGETRSPSVFRPVSMRERDFSRRRPGVSRTSTRMSIMSCATATNFKDFLHKDPVRCNLNNVKENGANHNKCWPYTGLDAYNAQADLHCLKPTNHSEDTAQSNFPPSISLNRRKPK